MKKNDLAEIYRMWGGDVWPRGFLLSTAKQVADVVDRDTVFHHPDILVVGGDPVTRFFALRALSHRHAGASILITPPRHPSESFAPWLQEESHLKWFKERFGFESYEAFFKKMSQTAIPHLLEHSTIRQARKFAVVSTERSLMVLKDRGSFDDAWGEWHRVETLASGYMKAVPFLKREPGLTAGRFKSCWILSGCSIKRAENTMDFSFCISGTEPISKACFLWKRNLEALWSI
jgi:hypothetical protein